MAERKAAEVFPPGEFIAEELEARGWSQVDLAEILGLPPSVISNIIMGKRSITPEIAKMLGNVFGTSAAYWMNMESVYQLSHAKEATSISKKTGEKVINTKYWYPSTLDYLCEMVINDAPKTKKDLQGIIKAIEQAKRECITAIAKIPFKHTRK